jgi:hypothetical protein
MACLRAALHQWLDDGGDLTELVDDAFDYLAEGLTVHGVDRVPTSA